MRRLLAIILSVALVSPNMAVSYAEENSKYNEFTDIHGHWAEQTIKKHHQMGMLNGYPDGTFKPDQQMKRSELIRLINMYFGLKKGGGQNFSDVSTEEWYAKETEKAKYYGYIEELEAKPEELASREDVVNMVTLILDMEEKKQKNEKLEFQDIDSTDQRTQENIEDFSKMGYISGYEDGNFKPKEIINRAEIMTIVENVLGYIVTSQDDIDNMPSGVTKITIINPGLKIENKDIEADIYITPGVDGKILIKNSKIQGKIEVSGGTVEKPIQFDDVQVEEIVITKVKETPKVEILGKSKISKIKIKSDSNVEVKGETEVGDIEIEAKTKLELKDNTKIENLKIDEEIEIETEKGIEIEDAEINNETKINGAGTIKRALIGADEVEIEKKPEYVKVTDGNQAKIGNEEVTKRNDDDKESRKSGSSSKNNNENKNTAPDAVDDSATVKENETVLIDVLLNDRDEDNDEISIDAITQGANGVVEKEGNKLRYTPDADYAGTDSFTYTIVDTDGSQDTAEVDVTIFEVDDSAPIWENGYPYALKTDEDQISLFTKINEEGTVYYSVYQSVYDMRSEFTVEEFVSHAKENDWTMEIQNFENEYKTVCESVYSSEDDFKVYFLAEDRYENLQKEIKMVEVVKVALSECDGSTGEQAGTIKITANTSGERVYYIVVDSMSSTPSAMQIKSGKDSDSALAAKSGSAASLNDKLIADLDEGSYYDIYFVAEDNKGNVSNIRKVKNVKAAVSNRNPQANDDSVKVDENAYVWIDLLANDSDADSDTISISSFTNPEYGTIVREGDRLKYTPNTDYSGTDGFTYSISDGNGGTDTAAVSIKIVDKTAPTAIVEYFKSSDSNYSNPISGPFKMGTEIVIKVTFSEAMKDIPEMKIGMNGVENLTPSNMTRKDSAHYIYNYIIPSGDGVQNIVLSNGTDVDGNEITSVPESGGSFTIDNTAPMIISAELEDDRMILD